MQHLCTRRSACRALQIVVGLCVLVLASCGDGKNLPKVYPVKGKILVNGQPAEACQIALHRTSADTLSVPATPQAVTDKNGEFQLTSYYGNDGAPEGEYVVTIEWRDRSGVSKSDFEGPDQLGGVYAKVDKTKGMKGFVVEVKRQPLELPPFELTQSAEVKRRLEEARKRKSIGGGPLQ